MQLSNEGLTTAPGSYPGGLKGRAESDSAALKWRVLALCLHPIDQCGVRAGRPPQPFAAMKIDRPKPVRWCSAWSTPISVQNHGCSFSCVTPKFAAQNPLARSTVM